MISGNSPLYFVPYGRGPGRARGTRGNYPGVDRGYPEPRMNFPPSIPRRGRFSNSNVINQQEKQEGDKVQHGNTDSEWRFSEGGWEQEEEEEAVPFEQCAEEGNDLNGKKEKEIDDKNKDGLHDNTPKLINKEVELKIENVSLLDGNESKIADEENDGENEENKSLDKHGKVPLEEHVPNIVTTSDNRLEGSLEILTTPPMTELVTKTETLANESEILVKINALEEKFLERINHLEGLLTGHVAKEDSQLPGDSSQVKAEKLEELTKTFSNLITKTQIEFSGKIIKAQIEFSENVGRLFKEQI